jgi:hypothetical protein
VKQEWIESNRMNFFFALLLVVRLFCTLGGYLGVTQAKGINQPGDWVPERT